MTRPQVKGEINAKPPSTSMQISFICTKSVAARVISRVLSTVRFNVDMVIYDLLEERVSEGRLDLFIHSFNESHSTPERLLSAFNQALALSGYEFTSLDGLEIKSPAATKSDRH